MVSRQRILACRFPHLPVERIARARWGLSWRLNGRPEAPPIVIAGQDRNALRVSVLEADPRLAGLQVGMMLADARAIFPQVDCVPEDREADTRLLGMIARWCERYTPLVAISEAFTLFLDISGCAHLFGGEGGLADDLVARLKAQGFAVQVAIADTAGAAFALATHHKRSIVPPGQHRGPIEPLPLGALRLEKTQVRELARVGLKTIGCLYSMPRASLTARFGPRVLTRLDQALGDVDEVLSPLSPPVELVTERRFFEPVVRDEDIRATIGILSANLREPLERLGSGLRRAELVLFRSDGRVTSLKVETATPLRAPARIARLFDERIAALHDDWDAGFGFDVIRLSVLRFEPYTQRQDDFMSAEADNEAVDHLVDRLSARLGADRVARFATASTHIPERRYGLVPALRANSALAENLRPGEETALRPVLIFEHPEIAEVIAELPDGPPLKFRWRKVLYEVARAEGPERIACEWWKDGRAAPTRDYFRLETSDGYRLWLFREGLYAREKGQPRWFVQGLFA